MGWLNALLAILSKFLGWQEAKAQERVATVDDRRKADAAATRERMVNEAHAKANEMDAALARGDWVAVERLTREFNRGVPPPPDKGRPG